MVNNYQHEYKVHAEKERGRKRERKREKESYIKSLCIEVSVLIST